MNYEFALDKKAAISLLAGSIVMGVLLFLAGWIVGKQWTPVASAATTTGAEEQGSELPKEPVLNEDGANSETPKSVNPKVTSPKEAPKASTAPTAAASQGPAAKTVGEVLAIQTAGDDGAATEDQKTVAETEYVTVQIGVFLDEKEASRLLQQIERKGYAPTFFSGIHAEARQWYAVRIGAYSDKQQAANAAANFTKQEKIKAVVRPAGSL